MNNSCIFQPDTTINITNTVQDIPVVLDNTSPMIPIITPPTTPPDENQLFLSNTQAILPNHSLQPTQNFQTSHSHSLTYPQETSIMNGYSFFYKPCNDSQMYHIVCEEIPLSFEFVAGLINNSNPIISNNTYRFYHEQPGIKKIYQVTCEMIPHAFIFQFLNKILYNIEFTMSEYQRQEFSEIGQENLKFHLKRDLIHYLIPKNVYEDNHNLHKRLVQDYRDYENIMNSNTDSFNHFQQHNANTTPFDQSFTSHEDNNCQLVCLQNDKNDIDNYNHYYDNQP